MLEQRKPAKKQLLGAREHQHTALLRNTRKEMHRSPQTPSDYKCNNIWTVIAFSLLKQMTPE